MVYNIVIAGKAGYNINLTGVCKNYTLYIDVDAHVSSIRRQVRIIDTIHFNVVWFVDVFQNSGFKYSSYVLLRRNRANFVLDIFLYCYPMYVNRLQL